ncbi:hypothetical protein TNCV_4130731 [Trichonephila clavipes]|nr:hypothetical protein TNCV_4130731 [Trichonephila clavipes]
MSSSGRPISNVTFRKMMRLLSPEKIEVQSRKGKHTDEQSFTRFNRMDNIEKLSRLAFLVVTIRRPRLSLGARVHGTAKANCSYAAVFEDSSLNEL